MNVGIERFLLMNVAAGHYSMHLAVLTHNCLLLLSVKDCIPTDLDTQNILQLRLHIASVPRLSPSTTTMKNEACGARAWERGEVAHVCSIGMSHTILIQG